MSMIKPVKSKRYKKREWLLDVRVNHKRIRARFPTQADAETAAVLIRHDKQRKRFGVPAVMDSPPFTDLIERRCATIQHPKERRRARTLLSLLVDLLPRGIAVDQITQSDLQAYVESRQKAKIQPQSINRELNTISSALHCAQAFYPQLQSWNVPKIPRPKNRNHRRDRYITHDERWAIIDHLRAGNDEQRLVGLVFQFALVTAMRHGEIDHLMWSDVGEADLKVRETKNVKNRYVPIGNHVREILKARHETQSRYVFTRSGSPQKDFYGILRGACQAVDVPYGDEPNGLRMHDTRHTATTDMLQAGIDLATIQSITGHSDRTMILYYSHPTGESRARAANVLNAVLERKTA